MRTAKSKWSGLGWAALAVAAIVAMGTARIANASIMVFSGEVDKVDDEVSGTLVTMGHFFKATLLFDNNAFGAAGGQADKPEMVFQDALLSLDLTYYDATWSEIFSVMSTGPASVTVKDEETNNVGVVKQKDQVKSKGVSINGTSVEFITDPIAGTVYDYVPTSVDITIDAFGLSGLTLDDLFALDAATFAGKVDLKFQAMNKDGTLAMKEVGKSLKPPKALKSEKIKGKIIPVPEPSSLALLALGLLALGVTLRRRGGSNA